MAIYKVYECTCDRCNAATEHYVGSNVNRAKKWLREKGWTAGRYLTCSACIKARNPEPEYAEPTKTVIDMSKRARSLVDELNQIPGVRASLGSAKLEIE